MKRTTVYCDRCGDEIKDFPRNPIMAVAEITYDGSYKGELDASKDLCKGCYEALKAWWYKGGRADE